LVNHAHKSFISHFYEIQTLAVVQSADISMVGVTDDAARNPATEYQSLRKRKFTRYLRSAVQSCIEHHCKMEHPTTDYLRTRIDAALQVALEGVDVEEILLSRGLKAANPAKKNAGGKQDVSRRIVFKVI
jgi:hypothetical protein